MKLTKSQICLLRREIHAGGFICLYSPADDTVAKNLSAKGLGSFVSFASHYSWRSRGGFINHFRPSCGALAMVGRQNEAKGCAGVSVKEPTQ